LSRKVFAPFRNQHENSKIYLQKRRYKKRRWEDEEWRREDEEWRKKLFHFFTLGIKITSSPLKGGKIPPHLSPSMGEIKWG